MKRASLLTVVWCLPFWLACGRSSDVDPMTRLEADLGGSLAVMEALESGTERDRAALLSAYDIGHVEHALSSTIDDCPKYFPAADRNAWHELEGASYYIDTAGRPSRAYAYLPPVESEPRSTSCQSQVGRWGDAEDTDADYDGGHLIGAQLGGWGRRANLVPQEADFNQGNWVALENRMARCRVLPAGRMRYAIRVRYDDARALVPTTFEMEIENVRSGDRVTLTFENHDGGGVRGSSEKNRGLAFLEQNGCR